MENTGAADLSVDKRDLSHPSLSDVAAVFETALTQNFKEVSVGVVDCPDLTEAPYRMAAKGLGGATKIADVGGTGYLTPTPQLDHKYNLKDIGRLTNSTEGCFILGAGAGPYYEIGCNCELMANMYVASNGETKISSQVAKLNQDGSCVVSALTTPSSAILGNFFISRGEKGKVIEVKAKYRTGSENFITILRHSLKEIGHDSLIGVGGIFIVKTGKVKIHVMPDFSNTPLSSDEDVKKWLRMFEFPTPMIFQSVFLSDDPGMDLRLEHSHGYSLTDESGKCHDHYGGHYHYDTTPDEVEYLAYFNTAEVVYRIDRPKQRGL